MTLLEHYLSEELEALRRGLDKAEERLRHYPAGRMADMEYGGISMSRQTISMMEGLINLKGKHIKWKEQ